MRMELSAATLLAAIIMCALCVSASAQNNAPAKPPVPPPPGAPAAPPVPAPVQAAPPVPAPPAAVPAAPEAPAEVQEPVLTPTESWAGTVTQLQSADRMTVSHGGTTTDIRLYGVDAPEPGQPLAEDAKKLVSTAVTGQQVKVGVLTRDNLGVAVAMVTLPDGRNLGHMLLEEGLAWWDRANAPDDHDLKKLNATAIAAGKNIWADPASLAPWDFRASHGGEQFTYTVKPAEAPAAAPAKKEEAQKDEPKKISAKGNEEYIGTFSIPTNAKLPDGIDPNQLLVQHMPSIAKDASGKAIGVAVPGISSIPFANQLGFQDGDVVSSVNGIPLQDPAQIMALVPQFKDVKKFNVQVIRGGKPMNLTINVP